MEILGRRTVHLGRWKGTTMKIMSLLALIGLLLILGISEILLCRFLLGVMSNPLVVVIMGTLNFLLVLFVIRRQPVSKPLTEPVELVYLHPQGEVVERP